jgi:hypothetical protein
MAESADGKAKYSVKVIETPHFHSTKEKDEARKEENETYMKQIRETVNDLKSKGNRVIGYQTYVPTKTTFIVYASEKSDVPEEYEIRTSKTGTHHSADVSLKSTLMAEIRDMKEKEIVFILKKREVL